MDPAFSRAGEWMLDNFYIVEQTFRQIEEGLPAKFVKQLPKLDGTLLKDHPRIFALAWEWIGYSQSQIDLTQAATFVQDYQQVTPLTIGELWALPIMLRIGILEQLVNAAAELTRMDLPPLSVPIGTFGTLAEPGLSRPVLEPGLSRPVLEPGLSRPVLEPGLPTRNPTNCRQLFSQPAPAVRHRLERLL